MRDEIAGGIDAEAAERKDAVAGVEHTLRSYATGGVHIEVMGLI